MSDSYTIDGVTITPQAGGYYDLTHPSLVDPVRVRGKENADRRAQAIAADAAPAEGSMEPQGAIPDIIAGDNSAEIAELKAALARQEARIAELLRNPPQTVVTNGEPPAPPPSVGMIPQEFTGQVDANTRKAAAKLGIEYVTIILEEGEDIPPTGLYLGHNGRGYMISPGEKVDVPDFLLEILDNAVMASPIVDTKTQKVLGYRNRMRYPYRRV